MNESSQWVLIGAAAVVVLAMVVRTVLRLRRGGSAHERPGAASGTPPRAPSKIERIKRYREQHNVGLRAAKEAIEAELDGRPPPARDVPPSSAASPGVEALIDAGQLIEAIKLYRQLHGVGLKEAKDAVDALRDRRGS